MCLQLQAQIQEKQLEQLRKNKEQAASLLLRLQSRYKEMYKDYDTGSEVSYVERVSLEIQVDSNG